jgi:hypothetical protein
MFFLVIGFAVGGLFARAANRVGKNEWPWGFAGGLTFLFTAFLFEILIGVIEAGLLPWLSLLQKMIGMLFMGAVMGLMVCLLIGLRFLRGPAPDEVDV